MSTEHPNEEYGTPRTEIWEAIPNSVGIRVYHCKKELSEESQKNNV